MTLKEKAKIFEDIIFRFGLDEMGIPLLHIRRDNFGPLTAELFTHAEVSQVSKISAPEPVAPHEYYMYENPGMCAADLMVMLYYKNKLSPEKSTIDFVRRIFGGLEYIYKLGEPDEPGLTCKPYGRRVSNEQSGDEIGGHMTALWFFREYFASGEEKMRVNKYIKAIGEYWLRHDFKHNYFGEPHSCFSYDRTIPRTRSFLKMHLCLLLYSQVSGDTVMMNLVERQIRQAQETIFIDKKFQQEPPESRFYNYCLWTRIAYIYHSMGNNWAKWRELAVEWANNYQTFTIEEKYSLASYQPPFPELYLAITSLMAKEMDSSYAVLGYIGDILARMELDHFCLKYDPCGLLSQKGDFKNRLPQDAQFETKLLAPAGITKWLEAYWHGKLLGILP